MRQGVEQGLVSVIMYVFLGTCYDHKLHKTMAQCCRGSPRYGERVFWFEDLIRTTRAPSRAIQLQGCRGWVSGSRDMLVLISARSGSPWLLRGPKDQMNIRTLLSRISGFPLLYWGSLCLCGFGGPQPCCPGFAEADTEYVWMEDRAAGICDVFVHPSSPRENLQ